MLASCIMRQRRTTVMVDEDALATLGFEAKRRNVPLAEVLREAIDEKAVALRTGRRPRVGVARSTDGRRASEVTAEPVAEPPGP
jgi:hypothetical protein